MLGDARPGGPRARRARADPRGRRAGGRASPASCWPSAASRCSQPRVIDLNARRGRDCEPMLRRLIGDDIELDDRPRRRRCRGDGGSGPARAGADEPGGQRPRRDARGGTLRDRRPRTSTLDAEPPMRPASARAVRRAGGHRHRRRAWTPRRSERIFEPFFTTKDRARAPGSAWRPSTASSTRAAAGSTSQSSVGQGTTFTVVLPAAGEPPRRRPAPGPERPTCCWSRTSRAAQARVMMLEEEGYVSSRRATAWTRSRWPSATAEHRSAPHRRRDAACMSGPSSPRSCARRAPAGGAVHVRLQRQPARAPRRRGGQRQPARQAVQPRRARR